ncbi:glycosyl hydrolase [Haematococcus lacustris]
MLGPQTLGRQLSNRAALATSALGRTLNRKTASRMQALASRAVAAPVQRALRPIYHLQPNVKGWVNDPNGIHWDPATGLYHMFYQHFREGAVWRWGLSWGHATSSDLLHWHHLPPALDPTPGGPDCDGVWSGCAFPTNEGTVILNTACRLRATTPASLLPPPHLDLGLQMIESQAYAVSVPGDPLLRKWVKGTAPLLALPPSGSLTGWRDPFLIGRPDDGIHKKWTMLVGAGHAAPISAGTALVYTSDHPTSGWEYSGELCRGNGSHGSMWECPLLAAIPSRPTLAATHMGAELSLTSKDLEWSKALTLAPPTTETKTPAKHAFIICPDNAHHAPLYYMGDYNADKLQLDLDTASGPFPLDLGGATLYAPNLLTNDPLGRVVLWGWCQEIGRPAFADTSAGSPASSGPSDAAAAAPEAAAAPDHESACCLSLPRLLWQHPTLPGRLWQEPLPAMSKLREEVGSGSLASWQADKINLTPNQPHALPPHLCHQSHLELEVTFDPPSCPVRKGRVAKSGLMLYPVPTDNQDSGESNVPIGEASGRHGAVLLFDWQEQRLDVVFNDGSVSLQQLAAMPMNRYRQLNSQSVVAVGPSPPSSPGHPTCSIDATEERARSCTPLMHHLHGTFEDDGGSSDDEAEVERRAINISGCHAVGGALHFAPANKSHAANKPAWQPITLRIFLDHSLLEVFTSTGEVLTSRVYRGARETQPVEPAAPPMHFANKSVLQLVSVGVPCTARNVAIHQMSSIWHEPEALAVLEQAAAAKVAAAAAGAVEPSRPSAPASSQAGELVWDEQAMVAPSTPRARPAASPCRLVVVSPGSPSPARCVQAA